MKSSIPIFNALPAYPGSKRRLVGRIVRFLPPPETHSRFADPFFGGGSVSLLMKARGYEVTACDIAERAYLTGRALLVNDHQTITDTDCMRLLEPNEVEPFVEPQFAPRYVSVGHARTVDRMLGNLDRFEEGLKRDLMKYVVLKYLLALMPFNQFSASGSYWEPLDDEDFDRIRPQYHLHLKTAFLSPLRLLQKVARTINRGVFGNGRKNRMYQMDVFEFLSQVEADILYLDPPYGGTLSYEREFRRLDQMLALDLGAALPVSVFSQKGALRQVERLFEMTRDVPVTILSYGNAAYSLEELTAAIRPHRREVEAHEIRYRHMENRARVEKNRQNREYLIIARK